MPNHFLSFSWSPIAMKVFKALLHKLTALLNKTTKQYIK
jgi:hypothetical protein